MSYDDDAQDAARPARRPDSRAGESDELTKKFNSLVFPGTQGGPLMHVIAAKAVAFKEAMEPSFKDYQAQVCENAKVDGGRPRRTRLPDRVRRHRQPPDARQPDRARHHGQGCGCGARARQHHGQQECRAERSAVAVRDERSAPRHARDHHARLRQSRRPES